MSKMQEEHNYLRSIIIQLKNIVEEGGIPTMVMNKEVMVKSWLHLCCGDTAGLNKLCGRKATNDAYRECVCKKVKNARRAQLSLVHYYSIEKMESYQ